MRRAGSGRRSFECHGQRSTDPLQDDNEAVWYIAAQTAAATAASTLIVRRDIPTSGPAGPFDHPTTT